MNWIKPDWPAPKQVKAISTTRRGGYSQAPFDSLNLGTHVEDDLATVLNNRAKLKQALSLPSEPVWLEQSHSTQVVDADNNASPLTADASVSHQSGKVCIVMTADCLPVLLTNNAGTMIAAAHAGWRGLNDGILESTINRMQSPPEDIIAWLGPAIGSEHFEVGGEVREAFMKQHKESVQAFVAGENEDKWFADIYKLARIRLAAMGVSRVYGGGYCTYADKERFFSYRREAMTGRMASLIWLD